MRWFSHRSRTWKDTVLKIKIKKKTEGFTLVATALAVLCWIFIAQAFFMMSSGTLSTVKAERTAYQAEQNTALDVSRLKALDYDDLDSKGAHARKVIEGVGDGNWESEVTIDPEQPLNGGDDDAKLRIAHVKVYRTGDTTSRYSLDVPLTSQNGKEENLEISIEKGSITDILYFTPHWSLYSPSSAVSPWPVSDGKVSISYQHEEKIEYYLNSSIGKFSLTPAFPSHDVFKTVIVGGGLSKGTGYVPQTDVKKYVEDHLDEFKEKAYTLIPESRKATEFVVNDPSIYRD